MENMIYIHWILVAYCFGWLSHKIASSLKKRLCGSIGEEKTRLSYLLIMIVGVVLPLGVLYLVAYFHPALVTLF